MALLVPCPFTPLLLPPPPEPPPPLVFLLDLSAVGSSYGPPVPLVPPDPPDLSHSMCRFFFSSAAPATPLSVCLVNLSDLAMPSFESFYDSFTAVCRLSSGCYPAPSSSSRFDFVTTNYLPHGSQICGYLLVVFGIRSEMFVGWVCEALFSAFDSITGSPVGQSFITYSLCGLTSSLCHNENEVLVVLDLDSHVSVFMVSDNNYVALVRYFSAVCRFQSVYVPTVVVLVLLSYQWMKSGKKSDIICLLTFHRICLVFHRLTYFVMEFICLLNSSLGLNDSGVWSFVLMIASCFSASVKNLYLEAQDSPAVQDFSYWLYYDFTAIVAECLALFDVQVTVNLLSISKLVCKSDCEELSCLLSENWSFDVLWILFAIRSFILSLESLSGFMFFCACNMANPLATLSCMSSLNGV